MDAIASAIASSYNPLKSTIIILIILLLVEENFGSSLICACSNVAYMKILQLNRDNGSSCIDKYILNMYIIYDFYIHGVYAY